VTRTDVHAAAARIRGRVIRTPLRQSTWLSDVAGCRILLKLETLQPTFSYKIRGAFNVVLRLKESHGSSMPPLVTASAGNHGRALAHAARDLGVSLTVYAPEQAPRTKLDAIRTLDATLHTCRDYDEAERSAKAHAADGRSMFVSPYAHPDVIAGAGTVGLEILDDCPDCTAIVVAIGGGGLIGGIAVAVGSPRDNGAIEVLGVEAEASSPFTHSLAAGRIVEVDVKPTLADGLAGNLDPDSPTFEMVRQLVTRIVLVDEDDLAAAIRGLAMNERLISEGAGAAAVAAVLSKRIPRREGPIAVVVSGANIDPEKLKALM
jgi:threonine dehydratase